MLTEAQLAMMSPQEQLAYFKMQNQLLQTQLGVAMSRPSAPSLDDCHRAVIHSWDFLVIDHATHSTVSYVSDLSCQGKGTEHRIEALHRSVSSSHMDANLKTALEKFVTSFDDTKRLLDTVRKRRVQIESLLAKPKNLPPDAISPAFEEGVSTLVKLAFAVGDYYNYLDYFSRSRKACYLKGRTAELKYETHPDNTSLCLELLSSYFNVVRQEHLVSYSLIAYMFQVIYDLFCGSGFDAT
jgi:hypothetical protein